MKDVIPLILFWIALLSFFQSFVVVDSSTYHSASLKKIYQNYPFPIPKHNRYEFFCWECLAGIRGNEVWPHSITCLFCSLLTYDNHVSSTVTIWSSNPPPSSYWVRKYRATSVWSFWPQMFSLKMMMRIWCLFVASILRIPGETDNPQESPEDEISRPSLRLARCRDLVRTSKAAPWSSGGTWVIL